jgi:AcrR family transcriptional regulator
VGTVYRHFPNRDALLDEVFEERIDELTAFAEESLATPDAWQGLVDFLQRLEETSAANRGLEQLVTQTPSGHGHERVADARERLAAPIARLVERAKGQGTLREDFDASDVRIVHVARRTRPHPTSSVR